MLSAKHFGENLSRIRNEKELKQSDIASRIFVTPQTVSKWERGQSYPELEKMIQIAELLHVPLEELFQVPDEAVRRKLFVGVDGGGTKTEFVVAREDGKILRRLLLGPSNPNVVGVDETLAILERGLLELRGFGRFTGVFVGLAGGETSPHRGKIENFLKKKYPNSAICLDSDIGCVFGCAPDTEKCIAVISGTGSVVYGFDGKTRRRAGGYGYLFEKGGSGFFLGREAVFRALRKSDGISKPSILAKLVEDKVGGDTLSCIGSFYENGNDYVASFAPLVFQAAGEGDREASEIIERCFSTLGEEIKILQKTMDVGNTVIFAGSLGHCGAQIKKVLLKTIRKNTKFVFPDVPPVYGACVQAMRISGESLDMKAFTEKFKASYEAYTKSTS